MAAKPQTAAGYSQRGTDLAERVLLEVWSRLGDYHSHLVLVGGLAPRYIVPQPAIGSEGLVPRHFGTLDVDLALSLAVADLKTYQSIRSTLVDTLGFEPGTNDRDREQRHSFAKKVGNIPVLLDFLTATYGGPDDSLMRAVEQNLSAIQVQGMGLALRDPLQAVVEGELLEGERYEATLNVCRPVPFVVLKALAFDKRVEPKDAYDLVYVLRYYKNGVSSVAAEVRKDERSQESFELAVSAMKKHFKDPGQVGPRRYGQFYPAEANGAAQAYATVRGFLEHLGA
jgi:hypothetical protein